MAKCNSTKNNRNGLKVFAIIVSILLVVCLVASLCVIGRTTNGFKEIPEFDDDVEEDTFVVDPVDDDDANNSSDTLGVKLYAEKIPEEDYEIMGLASDTIGAYTVTASYEPSNADIMGFTWSLALDTSWSGYSSSGDYTDYYGTVWSSSADFIMSDYITLSGDDTLSVTVTCNQVFGCPVILTFEISDLSEHSFSSQCRLNCNTYSLGISLDLQVKYLSSATVSKGIDSNTSLLYFYRSYLRYSTETLISGLSLYFEDGFSSVSFGLDSSYLSNWCDFVYYSGSDDLITQILIYSPNDVSKFSASSYDEDDYIDFSSYHARSSFDLDFVASYLDEFTVGTLVSSDYGSCDVTDFDFQSSILSGLDSTVLLTSSSSSISVSDALSSMQDSSGVYLTPLNLSSGNVSYSFLSGFSSSSSPLFTLSISIGNYVFSIPMYLTNTSLFSVSLTGSSLSSSNLVFN